MKELAAQKNSHKKQKTAADSVLGMDSVANGNDVNRDADQNEIPESDVGKKRPMGNKKAKVLCVEVEVMHAQRLWTICGKKRRKPMQRRNSRKKRDTNNLLN